MNVLAFKECVGDYVEWLWFEGAVAKGDCKVDVLARCVHVVGSYAVYSKFT